MANITHQRCHNHTEREAAARCLECSFFFCRECATEHDDRVICAACLKKLVGDSKTPVRGFSIALRAGQLFVALFILWSAFYFTGRMLVSIPNVFHDSLFSSFDQGESDK